MRPATQGAPDTGGRINPSARNKIPPIGGGAGTPTSINTPVKSATLGDNSTGDDGYVLLTFSVSTGSVCMPKTHPTTEKPQVYCHMSMVSTVLLQPVMIILVLFLINVENDCRVVGSRLEVVLTETDQSVSC